MGYFSNGCEGMDYEGRYCDHCVHKHKEYGCPCLEAHALWNYEECNKDDSILHKMIPRKDDGWNDKCIFFLDAGSTPRLDIRHDWARPEWFIVERHDGGGVRRGRCSRKDLFLILAEHGAGLMQVFYPNNES